MGQSSFETVILYQFGRQKTDFGWIKSVSMEPQVMDTKLRQIRPVKGE